jgi:hypothetical protein
MFIEAMEQLDKKKGQYSGVVLEELDLITGLTIANDSKGTEIQVVMSGADKQLLNPKDSKTFTIYSRTQEDKWMLHSRGSVSMRTQETMLGLPVPDVTDLGLMDASQFYGMMSQKSPHFGPSFQNITEIYTGQGVVVATVVVPQDRDRLPDVERSSFGLIHPATLDACFQAAWGVLV